MSVTDWSVAPDANAVADPTIPARDGASARQVPELVRGVMAKVAAFAADQGGALVTAGTANAYAVTTTSGVAKLRSGVRLAVRPDRDNTAAASLSVDGAGPKAWLDANGAALGAGRLRRGRLVTVSFDAERDAWLSDTGVGPSLSGVGDVPGLPAALTTISDDVDARFILVPNLTALASYVIPDDVTAITVARYRANTPEAPAIYRRVGSVPSHALHGLDASGARWALCEGVVTAEMAGATGDGTANDRDAIACALVYALRSGAPLGLSGSYNLGAEVPAIIFGAITVRPGPNARIIGNYDLHDPVTVTSALRLERQDPFNTYPPLLLQPTYKRPIGQKTLHLSEGDVIYDNVAKMPGNGLILERLNWGAGNVDTWVNETAAGFDVDVLLYNLTNDGFVHAGFRPAHGGDELSTAWDAGAYTRAAVIRGSFGTILAYTQGDGTLTIATKLIGQAATVRAGIDWTGRGDHPAWYPSNAVWTIRLYSLTQWTLMLNGVEILQPQTVPPGFITQMGFGAMASTTVQAAMRFFTRTRSTRSPGRGYFDILTGGDSTTADIHGAWPPAMLEALHGSLGASVRRVVNIAQDGATSVQQFSTLQATDLSPFSDVVLNIGTNDVQNPGAAGNRDASLARIGQMIDHCQARFKRVTILVFPTWYGKELTGAVPGGPVGVFTANSALSSTYRQGIKALAAAKTCKVVDLNEELEPALAYALINGQPDIVLRDNIHPTEFRYRMIGNLVAAALLGQWPRKTRALSETLLPAFAFQNGWIAGNPAPNVAITRDGWAKLAGMLKGGTMSGSGVVVLQLPPNLYPRSVKIGLLRGNANGAPVSFPTFTLNTGGTLTVFGGTETELNLDAIPAYEIAD